MMKQKLHRCNEIQETIQVNQYCRSMLQFKINAMIAIKLSDVAVSNCNYQANYPITTKRFFVLEQKNDHMMLSHQ